MLSLLNRFFRGSRGAAAVEFALLVPIILLTTAVIVELGRALSQAQAIEKGLRGGVMIAARSASSTTLTSAEIANIKRMVMTGTVASGGTSLVKGWDYPGDAGTVTITAKTCLAATCGQDTNYWEITAAVPYVELIPGIGGFFGLADVTTVTVHSQVYIGN